jgi:hypothetical protein
MNPHDSFVSTKPALPVIEGNGSVLTIPLPTGDINPFRQNRPPAIEGITPELDREFPKAARQELRKHLRQPSIGDAEFELSLRRASAKWDGRESMELIRLIGIEFDSWRAFSCPGASLRSAAQWEEARKNSELLAKRHLIGSENSVIANADALRAQANEAVHRADNAERQWQVDLAEFNRLPDAVKKLTDRLQAVAQARADLDAETLRQTYRQLYARLFVEEFVGETGATAARGINHTLGQIWQLIQERPMRLEILVEVEKSINAELKTLNAQAKDLRKKLGIKE